MKSSDLRQSTEYKRKAIHVQVLPTAVDFGEDIPYPIILSNWDDPNTGGQCVFSTYNGTDVKHWIGVGVDKDDGSLSAWQPDGSYKKVLLEGDCGCSTKTTSSTGTLPSAGEDLDVDHGVSAGDILMAYLLVTTVAGDVIEPLTSLLSGTSIGMVHTGTKTKLTIPLLDSSLVVGRSFKLTIISVKK